MTALNLTQTIIEFFELRLKGIDGHGKPIAPPTYPDRLPPLLPRTSHSRTFTANDLRQYVNAKNFGTAPASADRVMRNLRKAGKINYVLTNRAQSLYTAIPMEKTGLEQ